MNQRVRKTFLVAFEAEVDQRNVVQFDRCTQSTQDPYQKVSMRNHFYFEIDYEIPLQRRLVELN